MREYISDVLLDTGDNLVLIFPEPTDAEVPLGDTGRIGVPYARAFFFKVAVASRLKFHYDLFETLAVTTGVTWNYLGATSFGVGADILRISSDDWWIYHFGYAPLQDTLRVYRRIGSMPNETGFEYVTPDLPNPILGSTFGYIKGAEVYNWFDPPVETETIAFRNDKIGRLWYFGLYNESRELEIDPALDIVGKAYRLIPITKQENMIKMLKGDPAPFRRRMITVNGLRNYREEAYIPIEWKVAGNEMYVTWEDITGVAPPVRAKRIVRNR